MSDNIEDLHPELNEAVRQKYERRHRRDRRLLRGAFVGLTLVVAVSVYAVFVRGPDREVALCTNKDAVRAALPSKKNLVTWPVGGGQYLCERMTDDEWQALAKDPDQMTAHLNGLHLLPAGAKVVSP